MKITIIFTIIIWLVVIICISYADACNEYAWEAMEGATGYNLYIDEVKNDLGNVTSYPCENRPGLHTYYVTAYNEWGESPISNIKSFLKGSLTINGSLIIGE